MTRGLALALSAVLVSFTWALAQECTASSQPLYRDLPEVLRTVDFRLDTLTVSGTRDLTVVLGSFGTRRTVLGKPTENSIASASAVCRLAALWSTRGDSLIVNWIVEPNNLELVPDSLERRQLNLSDRPRPIAHTLRARIRNESFYQRMLDSARATAPEEIGNARTVVMTMIDERGIAVVSRLLNSSGVRALDEAALDVMFTNLYVPPDSGGTPVTAWYVTPILWRR